MSCNVFRSSNNTPLDAAEVSGKYAMLDTAFDQSDAMSDFVDKVSVHYRTSHDTDYRAHMPTQIQVQIPTPVYGGSIISPRDVVMFDQRADSFIREYYDAETDPTVPVTIDHDVTAGAPVTTTTTTGTGTSSTATDSSSTSFGQVWWKLLIAVVLLVLILYGLWWFFGRPSTKAKATASTNAAVSTSASGTPKPPSGTVPFPAMHGSRPTARTYQSRPAPFQMLFDAGIWE